MKLIICNAPKKSNHCLKHCFHGVPHEQEREKDACHTHLEFCNGSNGGILKVICRSLTKEELKEYESRKTSNI